MNLHRLLAWKPWALATGIAVVVLMSMPLQDFSTNRYWALWKTLYDAPWFLFISYAFLVAIAAAEGSVADAARTPTWRYVVAVATATLICLAAAGMFPELRRSAPNEVVAGQTLAKIDFADSEALRKTPRTFMMMQLFNPLMEAWLVAFIYVRLRNSRRAARALADAEVERSEAQRSLLAAQLVAVHAQVDPAFVLQELQRVERAYESDPTRADLLLDEFIAFLRAAIPRIRGDGSPEPEHETQGSPG